MSFDRYGRTPEQARADRVRFWCHFVMFAVVLALIVLSALMVSP